MAELPLQPHQKEVFDFIFLTNGKTVRSKSVESYEFSKNQFFFLPAYQITTMQSMTADACGYYCHFNSDIFYNKLFQKELLLQFPFLHFTGNPIEEIDAKAADSTIHLLKRLEQEYQSGEKCNPDFVASTRLTLFFEIKPFARSISSIKDNSAYRIANEYKNLLVNHIHENQKISFYADILTVSPEHLNRSIKSASEKRLTPSLMKYCCLKQKYC